MKPQSTNNFLMRQLKNAIEGNNVVNLLLDNVAKTSLYNMIVQRNIDAYLANIKKNKRLNIILETSNICILCGGC